MKNSKGLISEMPFLGAGLGFRRQLKSEIYAAKDKVDFVEIITDQYIQDRRNEELLEEICSEFRVIPHGVNLSVGSVVPLEENYLKTIKRVSDITESLYYSEHLCLTKVPGIELGHLSPLWFTEEVLTSTIKNVSYVQDYLGKPLVLENVTYLVDIPYADMTQTEFFNRLVAATGCGVLLDVTNIYINSVNHGFDPIAFLEQMPLENVVQAHIAGGYWSHGILVDSHSESVQEETWKLLRNLVAKTNLKGVILEHDSHFPEMDVLLNQVGHARSILENHIEEFHADPSSPDATASTEFIFGAE